MTRDTDECIRLMKEAVMSYRVVDLKECLLLFGINSENKLKRRLQNEVLTTIDRLRLTDNIPIKLFLKILEIEKRLKNKSNKRRRRQMTISWRKDSVYGQSPFFSTVEVLARERTITSHCSMTFKILSKNVQLLRKKKSRADKFSYEIQCQFRAADGSDVWIKKTIRLKVDGKVTTELRESPPIIYITPYCHVEKQYLNTIELELPDNEQSLEVVVSVVRRYSPSQLLEIRPLKKVHKVKNLLLDTFNETGDVIYNVSLVCPFEKAFVKSPCRTANCKHPDVFDALFFLEKMQYYLFWKCPVCQYPVTYSLLEIEMFFKHYVEKGKFFFTFRRDFEPNTDNDYTGEVITLD